MVQMRSVESEKREESAGLYAQLDSHKADLQAARESVQRLEQELSSKRDYDEIKKELDVLRSIEFEQEPSTQEVSLELRLKRKNEQLQNRIASISAEKDQIEGRLPLSVFIYTVHSLVELAQLREKTTDLSEREAQQKALISRLEEDLNRASSWRQNQYYEHPGSPPIPDNESMAAPLGDLLGSTEQLQTSADSSILSIVQSQRDRLRERNRELEEVCAIFILTIPFSE